MLKFTRILILSAGMLTAASVWGWNAPSPRRPNVNDIKHSITDSAIIYPESFEVDTRKLLEGWYMKNYTASDTRYATSDDADTDDATIIARLKALPTVIEMPFNSVVRSYIDRYTKRSRAQVAALLGLNLYYMPIFEQALEEQGLPLELKYLPIIESGLDPNVTSRHGAAGLWQFMLPTARGLGMEVNSLVDERRDPYLSSEKAAAYLKDLYQAYGDWSLAIAAYNCGPGAVNKAIRRAGGENTRQDFWSIYNYLPAETRGYVPMFIAANYVMNYYPQHNISPVLPTKPLVTDTIGISERIHFNQISKVLNIPVDELRMLNPQFRADVIPATSERQYSLILPSQQVHAYILSEEAIRNMDADKYARRDIVEPGDAVLASTETPAESDVQAASETAKASEELAEIEAAGAKRNKLVATIHKVEPGETLASIAQQYDVSQADIKRWNQLRRNAVRTGQQLRIMTPSEEKLADNSGKQPRQSLAASAEPNESSPQAASTSSWRQKQKTNSSRKSSRASTQNHKLKNGETLSSLAHKYGVSINDIKKANNMKNDNLRAGDNIKIPSKASKSKKSKSRKRRRR